jgi:hypothetical protein
MKSINDPTTLAATLENLMAHWWMEWINNDRYSAF